MDNKGEDVSRINVYLKTRFMGKGPSPEVLKIVQEMKIAPSHILESQQIAANKDKIFVEFIGRDGHSRVRTYGSGPSPTDIFGPSSLTIVGTTTSDRIQQMIESVVATRMAEYEARRDQEVEAAVAVRMVELDKRRADDISASVKQYLEFLGISIPSQESPRERSSVGQVPTASSEYEEERLEDEQDLKVILSS